MKDKANARIDDGWKANAELWKALVQEGEKLMEIVRETHDRQLRLNADDAVRLDESDQLLILSLAQHETDTDWLFSHYGSTLRRREALLQRIRKYLADRP